VPTQTRSIYLEIRDLAVQDEWSIEPKALENIDLDCTLKGHIRFVAGGKEIPIRGLWGPNDTDIEFWIKEFDALTYYFDMGDRFYSIDLRDSGLPNFEFKRLDEEVILQFVDQDLGERVCTKFYYPDFEPVLAGVKAWLFQTIKEASEKKGERFIRERLQPKRKGSLF